MSLIAAQNQGRSQVTLQHLKFHWNHTRGVTEFSGAKKTMWNSSTGIIGVAWINSVLRKRCLWPCMPSLPLASWGFFTRKTGKYPTWDWAGISLDFILISKVTHLLPLKPETKRFRSKLSSSSEMKFFCILFKN